MKKRIVIVGGGYLGAELAQSLQRAAEVTLIEQRSHFIHTSALIRAVVEPRLMDRSLIPYDRLLQDGGTLIRARATAVDADGVTLQDGTRVPADILVIATGSANALPFKAREDDIEGLRAANSRTRDMLHKAGTVAIVGAGTVGIELAGEIKAALPDKKIVLIGGEKRLMPAFPRTLGDGLQAKLENLGVQVMLGVEAEDLDSTDTPFAGTLTLSDGRKVEADLVFPVIGARPNTTLFDGLPGVSKADSGRIAVDGYLRPSSHPNVFAAGDVAETGDGMTVVGITRQLPWLKTAMHALAEGKELDLLKPYTSWKNPPILVPLGPYKGRSYLSLLPVGDFVTRMIKGKDLFVPKYRRIFNQP